jgi:hypothetical protein
MQERVRRSLFRLGGRVPAMPLGTRVLLLKGKANNDLGQMAVLSAMAGSCVEISHQGPAGAIKTRASLIRMDEGVGLVTNEEGWPIIRTRNNAGSTDSNKEIGRASSDDDSRAQQIKIK